MSTLSLNTPTIVNGRPPLSLMMWPTDSRRGTVELLRKFFGDDGDLVAPRGIFGIEEASGENFQIAHPHVVGINAEHEDVALLARSDVDAVTQSDGRRRGHDGRHLLPNRLHVLDCHGIGRGLDALRSTLIVGIDHVGADRLQLPQYVLLAREPDRSHQDYRSGAHCHRQRGECELEFVAAEGVVGEVQNFAKPDREAALRATRSRYR